MILSGIRYSRHSMLLMFLSAASAVVFAQKQLKSSAQKKEGTNDRPFLKVEKESGMKGGIRALRLYLDSNFNVAAVSHQWPATDTLVNDSLLVNVITSTKGILLSFEASDTVSAFFNEVKRVLKKSEPWIPAEQCGVLVKSYKRLVFYFRRNRAGESVWVRNRTTD